MSQEMERYLSKVKLWMFSMPGKARKGVIDELRSHIIDSTWALGGPEMAGQVVASMDSPRKTAKRYKRIYGLGLPFKILFVLVTIFLSILTVPIWQVAIPNFNTNFWFLILIILLFFVGSRAGKRMGLAIGITAFLTRLIVLGIIAAAAGEHGVIQGSGMFAYFLSSLLLIFIAYLPARAIEKWEERKAWDIPMSELQETRACPRCDAAIPVSSKFCAECGGRVW